MLSQNLLNNLICPKCGGQLSRETDSFACCECGQLYEIKNNIPFLLESAGQGFDRESADVLINRLKVFFKKSPFLFKILSFVFGVSFVGKTARQAIKNIGEGKIIINLGSGINVVRPDAINIDFYPFRNVNIVAHASHLPIKDNSVDAIVCESLLEHVKEPAKVVAEIKRVLKPGGLTYITAPFIAGFHSSPQDYYRWTKQGLREIMAGFEEKESGVMYGPTSALSSVLCEWLSLVLSFGSLKLHQFWLVLFTIITSPLKLLDYLFYRFPSAQNIAYGFYYIGVKPE
ncbi:MAG: methyltransferase domain-containing protein [Patescibacteria group bacterium]